MSDNVFRNNDLFFEMDSISQQYQFGLEAVREAYRTLSNYYLEDFATDSNLCVIYFTSHSFYGTNDESQARETLFESNRFEWRNTTVRTAARNIFLRDVYKQWYLSGISSTYNTCKRVYGLLEELTAGYRVITVGGSAGGYAALQFGCALGAEAIFAFSPQFNLLLDLVTPEDFLKNPLVVEAKSRGVTSLLDVTGPLELRGLPTI